MQKQDKKRFINPLTHSSETSTNASTLASTDTPTLPDTQASTQENTLPSTQTPTSTETFTSTLLEDLPSSEVARRKRGSQAFEKTHERFTSWIDKRLKKAFEKMVKDKEVSKTEMLNEAISDLLKKHGR